MPSATLVKDIVPGPGGAFNYAYRFTAVGGTVFFPAYDGVHANELWKSNGTAAGTQLVKDINPGGSGFGNPDFLTNVNGTLFFAADDGVHGRELWKSDGTADGTVLVKDIWPGGTYSDAFYSSNRAYFAAVNDTVFFAAGTSLSDIELWKSDGTEAGTVRVKDIYPGTGGSRPKHLTNVNGTLFFIAAEMSGRQDLWKTDGTEDGTVLVKENVTYAHQLAPVNVNGTLFFAAPGSGGGLGLWKSDGTEAGTVLVKDVAPGGTSGASAWMTNVNGVLYFAARESGTGSELWKSDGTEAGTVLVKDINPGSGTSQPRYLTNVNGTLFFSASSPGSGDELWKSDGTEAGTIRVRDIYVGAIGSGPNNLVDVGGTLYFAALSQQYGLELWKSDGTEEGTVLVNDFWAGGPGGLHSSYESLTSANGALFLAATDGGGSHGTGPYGRELWAVLPPDGPASPPALGPIADQTVNEGSLLTVSLSASDPDADDTLTFSLVSGPAGATIDPVTGVFAWTPDDGPDAVTVTVRVTDSQGLSDTRSFTVTVLNVAPTAGITGPTSGTPGQTLSFTLTATDPSSADQAAGFSYVIDWGDGSPLQTIDAFPGSGSGVAVSHAYALAGAYVVSVTAIDKDGGTGTAMLAEPVMIASVPSGVSDLSWSGGGIVTAATVGAGEAFTIGRTFAVGGEPVGPFTIAYWASLDDIFGNEDDFLVGVELIEGAAPGIHSGSSPAFTIGAPGTYFLFAVLDSDGQIDETDEANNLVMALATLLVTDMADDEE